MLVLRARLRFCAYDAGAEDDPRNPEWPPHPARLFCALVASDPSEREWEALRWLEQQDPPDVLAPRAVDEHSTEVFVPTNDVKAANPNLPGRINSSRRKPRLLPARDQFALTWPGAEPSDDVQQALEDLAARVPYVGRSTSSAEVWFSDEEPEGLDRYIPAEEAVTHDLRVPYAGYADALSDLHERGARSWEASRLHGYRPAGEPTDDGDDPIASPYEHLMVLRFVSPSHLHASRVVSVTDQLRRALLRLIPDPVPATISGHGADSSPHVAYLGLPNVGHSGHLPEGPDLRGNGNPHADGRLLGLAVAVPASRPELVETIFRALHDASARETGHFTLNLKGGEDIDLVYDTVSARVPVGARPTSWTRPSNLWATATPVVFDHYPKGREPAAMVADALMRAGYPAPDEVVANRSPILAGAPHLTRSRVQRRAGVPTKPWVHAWVRFTTPQRGPVLAGSMRYRGLGIFVPLTEGTKAKVTPEAQGDPATEAVVS